MTTVDPVAEMTKHLDEIRPGLQYLLNYPTPTGVSLQERHEYAAWLFCVANEVHRLSEATDWQSLKNRLLNVADGLREQREKAGDPDLV